jgi:hypothetical protein
MQVIGIVLAQIVKAGAALGAAVLGAPFSLDHVNSSNAARTPQARAEKL